MQPSLAVIGAGPGGLYAAREAVRLGLRVTVFERNNVGEKISCAEGFFDPLNLLASPDQGVRCKVQEVHFTAKDNFVMDCSRLNLWMIDRQEWQQALLEEVRALGCLVHERTPVTPELLTMLEKEFDWVIDARGATALKNKQFSGDDGRRILTALYTLAGDFSRLFGRLKIVFEPHYCGYYWIFPKSEEQANVGVGWLGKRPAALSIHHELERIVDKEALCGYTILKKAGGPIPTRRQKPVLGRTLLVGDAAGLASPLHGGGIDTACISGILAARAASAGDPGQYAKSLEKILAVRLDLEQRMLNLWRKLSFDEINGLLALVFGRHLRRFACLLKYRYFWPEIFALRSLAGGYMRADWQNALPSGCLAANSGKVTAVPERVDKLCRKST
jgi:digeranylgeranylglycerophospholipid reductase